MFLSARISLRDNLSRIFTLQKSLKMLKLLSSSETKVCFRYLNFYPDFFRHLEECLDRKAKVNFKTYDISKRETNNYNIHIAQYLKK